MRVLNNKGYSLLFTLVALLLISVIGISLISLSFNGSTRNENRENVALASDLSEKGTTYLTNQIGIELETKKNELKGATVTVDNIFNEIYSKYACKDTDENTVLIEGSKGDTSVCIEKIENKAEAELNNRRNTRLVTLRSIGEAAGSKQSFTTSVVEMGYGDIPEQLSYAVSTNENGNLYFFGGTEVEGNIKVSGDMYLSKYAFWTSYNTSNGVISNVKQNWIDSVPLKITSGENNQRAIIYTNKSNFLSFNNTLINQTNIMTGSSSIYNVNTAETTQFNNIITKVPTNNSSQLFTGETPQVRKFNGASSPINIGFKTPEDDKNKSIFSLMIDKVNYFSYPSGEFSRKYQNGEISYTKDYYFAKGNNMDLKGNSSQNKTLTLEGNYYVDGNLNIEYVDLKADAIIYVTGDVKITESTIQPLTKGLESGTLFIFADGKIEISNISTNSVPGKGSLLNGYFYSNSDVLMYGVGSNMRINGGMSGRNIIYTALRGNAKDKGTNKVYVVPQSCTVYNSTNCPSFYDVRDLPNITINNTEKNNISTWVNRLNNVVNYISEVQVSNWWNRYTEYTYRYNSATYEHLIVDNVKLSNNELNRINTLIQDFSSLKDKISTTDLQLIKKLDLLSSSVVLKDYDAMYSDSRISTNNNLQFTTRNKIESKGIYTNNVSKTNVKSALDKLTTVSKVALALKCEDNKNLANCTEINAIYGNLFYYEEKNQSINNKFGDLADSIENQLAQPSRLHIIYDKKLVDKYRNRIEDEVSSVQDLKVIPPKLHSINIK